MKKLFLTSGLIVCMACPAFASTDIAANAETADCTDTYLGDGAGDAESANLEAKWTPISYAISFAGGQAGNHTEIGYVTGSTAAVSPITFDSTNTPLTANGFSARGYQFDHWSSTVNLETGAATATNYNNQASLATYAYAGNPTLTANWTAKQYNVNYAAGTHGSGSSTDTNGAIFDTNYTIKGIGTGQGQSGVTADTGYHFVDWTGTSTDTAYTSANYTETQTITPYTIDAPLTLTANFAANTHTITYAPGAYGTGGTTDTATYDTPYVALATAAAASVTENPGYTFVGWNTETGQTISNWSGIPTWTAANDVDLTVYAAYTANGYQITFTCGTKPQGASTDIAQGGVAGTAVNVTYATAYAALPATAGTCSLPGYHFNGWSCANGITAAGGTYNYAGDTVCDATWAPNSIGLTWYADEDTETAMTVDSASQTCTYDGQITLPTAEPKTGYTFQGWKVRTATPAAE